MGFESGHSSSLRRLITELQPCAALMTLMHPLLRSHTKTEHLDGVSPSSRTTVSLYKNFGSDVNVRLADFLNRNTLHLSNNVCNTSNSNRLVPAFNHHSLLPLLLFDGLRQFGGALEELCRSMRRADLTLEHRVSRERNTRRGKRRTTYPRTISLNL